MTALARTSSNCARQTRPFVREGAPHHTPRLGGGGLDTKIDWATDIALALTSVFKGLNVRSSNPLEP
jgi:hypothetical protein